jgi:hypothetical protein
MPYRDWLRLQATDSPGSPGVGGATRPLSPASLSAPEPSTPPAPSADPPDAEKRAELPPWLWATSAIAAGLLVIGGAAWLRQAGGGPPPPPMRKVTLAPIASAAAPPPSAPKPSVAASTSVPAPRLPKTIPSAPASKPVPPLAALLQSPGAAETTVVVQATRAHSFERSAPANEGFFCLKLTDATDATVTTRAYAPIRGEIGTRAQSMLPWGRAQRVVVRLRWEKATPGDALAGYWQVVSLEDAASGQAALTSVR